MGALAGGGQAAGMKTPTSFALAAGLLISANVFAGDGLAEQLGRSQAAIINAIVAGAPAHAAAGLRKAREALELARRGADADHALTLARQAQAEAENAEARARAVLSAAVKTESRTPAAGG